MSPLREAVKNASASSRPRCFSTWKRGRASRTWVRARAASWRQAAGSRSIGGRDLVESQPEHIVQQEGGALERRQAFQRQHQRQGDVFLLVLFDDGIGKPGADIGLALVPRGFELIETQPRDRAAQERLGLAHLAAIGLHPADEGLLHHVLGVGDRAEHAVGDAHELRTQRVESRRCVLGRVRSSSGGGRLGGGLDGRRIGDRPKPTAMRFQPLMMLIISVSLTCSSSRELRASALHRRSHACALRESRVSASVQPSAARSRSV